MLLTRHFNGNLTGRPTRPGGKSAALAQNSQPRIDQRSKIRESALSPTDDGRAPSEVHFAARRRAVAFLVPEHQRHAALIDLVPLARIEEGLHLVDLRRGHRTVAFLAPGQPDVPVGP